MLAVSIIPDMCFPFSRDAFGSGCVRVIILPTNTILFTPRCSKVSFDPFCDCNQRIEKQKRKNFFFLSRGTVALFVCVCTAAAGKVEIDTALMTPGQSKGVQD